MKKKKMEKKQAILRAAQEVFSEKGLEKATISEIAKKADVVDSIIYHYFTNKQDLLFSSIEELIEKSHEELLFQFKGVMGPVSQLGKMVWFHLYENDFSSGDARKMKIFCLNAVQTKTIISIRDTGRFNDMPG